MPAASIWPLSAKNWPELDLISSLRENYRYSKKTHRWFSVFVVLTLSESKRLAMARERMQPDRSYAELLKSLVNSSEVLRLIRDITSCTATWEEETARSVAEAAKGFELFPCFTMYFQKNLVEITGTIYPNLVFREWEGLAHLIRLQLPGRTLDLRLHTPQATFFLSPFHIRFLSILFGRLVLHHLSLTPEGKTSLLSYTPYSLEEQVVAGYLQSLEWVPCATIKLDAQDNPYIGSMLHSTSDLRRCEIPGGVREEALIRAWRLFKRLLYYSIEGEKLYTGFAILPGFRPLEYYRKRLPGLLFYHEDHRTSLEEGLPALKQFLLNANGRTMFLALYNGQIIGLLHLTQGTHRQLTSVQAWRAVMPLTTISSRGRVIFWVPLRGRQKQQIPLAVLEYRHGHLHIPLFQDIFWQELGRHLSDSCPGCMGPERLLNLKILLEMVQHSGHGAIFLVGLEKEQLDSPACPLENQVFLNQPVPLEARWLQHLAGLAKSDGALIFNDRLEALEFRARLKAATPSLPPERDDLGSGMRHQVTREFTACYPNVLGLAISQDGYISLYRHGRLVSRLY
jgi:hypothetical protein